MARVRTLEQLEALRLSAIADLKTRLAALEEGGAASAPPYTTLTSQPDLPVAANDTARLRYANGRAEISVDGGAWAPIGSQDVVSAAAHGAVGDGATNDTAALQSAMNAAVGAGQVLVLEANKTYIITEELRLGTGDGAYVRLDGNGSTIKLAAAARSVLAIDGNVGLISGVTLNADRVGTYGVFLQTGSTSVFDQVTVLSALVDGFKSYADNDRCFYRNCIVKTTGRVFHTAGYAGPAPAIIRTAVTGTVEKTDGAECVITRDSGTVDFTTLGIRQGDFISLHANAPGDSGAEWLQIESVDSATQLTCTVHPVSTGAASGLQFSIHVGDGYHEGPGRADNNINRIDTFLAENIAGSGVKLGGLYGARCTNIQVNAACAYPVTVATAGLPCIGSSFHGCYFELCQPADNFFLGGAAGITIDTVNGIGAPVVSNGSFNWGVITNMQNAGDVGRIDPIGSDPQSYIPVKVIAADSYARGKIQSQNYAQNGAGVGYLDMRDSNSAGWKAKSGVEAGGADPNACGFEFDTENTVAHGAAKRLFRYANDGTELVYGLFNGSIGRKGALVCSDLGDSSGAAGNAEVNKAAGKSAVDMGQTTCTITNSFVTANSIVGVWFEDDPGGAFTVEPAGGSFVVTLIGGAAAGDLTFRWAVLA